MVNIGERYVSSSGLDHVVLRTENHDGVEWVITASADDIHSWVLADFLNYCKPKGRIMDTQPKLDGTKNDNGKPRLGLVARDFIWAIATIMTFGATKYGENNWLGGMEWHRPYDALQRHLTAWWDGEDKDEESGKSHLWHAACELMFLVVYEIRGIGKDDRYKHVRKEEDKKAA